MAGTRCRQPAGGVHPGPVGKALETGSHKHLDGGLKPDIPPKRRQPGSKVWRIPALRQRRNGEWTRRTKRGSS